MEKEYVGTIVFTQEGVSIKQEVASGKGILLFILKLYDDLVENFVEVDSENVPTITEIIKISECCKEQINHDLKLQEDERIIISEIENENINEEWVVINKVKYTGQFRKAELLYLMNQYIHYLSNQTGTDFNEIIDVLEQIQKTKEFTEEL